LILKNQPATGSSIRKTEAPDQVLRFSFKYFANDTEVCPKKFPEQYMQKLAERLKELSTWTVDKFTSHYMEEVRNHKIEWAQTSKRTGFAHLPSPLKDLEAWQFSVTRNAHGRVHGIILGQTFYIVWLDVGHKLYS
jgi:hypothetical protein